jgi:hypothetical protein
MIVGVLNLLIKGLRRIEDTPLWFRESLAQTTLLPALALVALAVLATARHRGF